MPQPSRRADRASPAAWPLAILATAATVLAQTDGPEPVIWFTTTSNNNGAVVVDRFGEPVRIVFGTLIGFDAYHRAPDGLVWRVPDPGHPQLEIRRPDGSLQRQLTPGSSMADLAFAADGSVWAGGANPATLYHYDADGNLLSSQPLPGAPRALAIDGLGGVLIAAENSPAPFLSRRDPITGALSTVSLPVGTRGPMDVVGHLVGGGVVAVEIGGQASTLFEFGTALGINDRLDLPDTGAVAQLEQTAEGDLWMSSDRGVFRMPADSRTPLLVVTGVGPRGPRRITIDPLGWLWVENRSFPWRFDAHTVQLDDDRQIAYGGGGPERPDLYERAWLIAPYGDDDGDGTANGVEVQLRTDPYDDQSSPLASLDIELITYRADEVAELRVGGLGGAGAILFAGGRDLSQSPIPGLLGDPRLDLATLAPSAAPVSVPGTLRLRVPPPSAAADALLCAQAVVGVARPRFSNHECTRTVRTAGSSFRDDFTTGDGLQQARSAARLVGGSFLTTGPIGGTGIHGAFVPGDGRDLGNNVFEWSTDSQVIPAARTLFGQPLTVHDGRFEFTDFRVPAGTTVRFVGSRPAVVRVAGLARIDGTLDLNGGDLEDFAHTGKNSILSGGVFTPGPGQRGTEAGAGGGRGGDGAFACDGSGNPSQPLFNGFAGYDGEDLAVAATHAYAANAAGTGGRGAALFPPSGDNSSLVFRGFGNNYCINSGSGGGGGGFRTAGSPGQVLQGPFITGGLPASPNEYGGPTPGGTMFPALDPRLAGAASLDHYLVSGSGGGGGGSHSLFVQASNFSDPYKFLSGGAGTGGGGAVALRVGNQLTIGFQGRIQARGGDGARTADNSIVSSRGIPAPGGAGSGGGVLLQVGTGGIDQSGVIEVRGGAGSTARFTGPFYFADLIGGDGASGSARLEVVDPGVQPGAIGQVDPPVAASVGQLDDGDLQTIALLGPYGFLNPTRIVRWRSYEIRAVVDGRPVVYTDAPSGYLPADRPGAPIRAWFRALGQPNLPTGAWRDYVNPDAGPSIAGHQARQVEVLLLFDRTTARDIRVDSLELVYTD